MTPRRRMIRAVMSLVITVVGVIALGLLAPVAAVAWIKVLHVLAVISWMAGLLYLPRLFVYHSQVAAGSETSETFKVMERKLLEYIINPAMIVSWIAGLWLAWQVYGFQGGWLHGKIALVLLLSGVHGFFAGAVRRFGDDRNTRSHVFWRVMNEVPTAIMVLVVILVIVKPF
ncbi:protoporphyrinogen oxidase HemJ [Phreatobacter sp.]|uniref:Protoporphyrinogen IX oxidase n=1 Tax=Microcystis aeruginosa DA14 TaxID=1987506 RepID=A0A3E0MDS7_MICAE|nr:protoporphyrinogen oxidase HemJ [Phreatobacter sp.]REJ57911.1 MAG: protoporphyrinogen oxidase HemJ [Microcystis aeruginosa DA14]